MMKVYEICDTSVKNNFWLLKKIRIRQKVYIKSGIPTVESWIQLFLLFQLP